MPTSKVPVGVSTTFGLSASTASFIAAVISAASGDRTPETLACIGSGVVTGAAVIVSRGLQAAAQYRAAHHAPADPVAQAVAGGSVSGALTVAVGDALRPATAQDTAQTAVSDLKIVPPPAGPTVL